MKIAIIAILLCLGICLAKDAKVESIGNTRNARVLASIPVVVTSQWLKKVEAYVSYPPKVNPSI